MAMTWPFTLNAALWTISVLTGGMVLSTSFPSPAGVTNRRYLWATAFGWLPMYLYVIVRNLFVVFGWLPNAYHVQWWPGWGTFGVLCAWFLASVVLIIIALFGFPRLRYAIWSVALAAAIWMLFVVPVPDPHGAWQWIFTLFMWAIAGVGIGISVHHRVTTAHWHLIHLWAIPLAALGTVFVATLLFWVFYWIIYGLVHLFHGDIVAQWIGFGLLCAAFVALLVVAIIQAVRHHWGIMTALFIAAAIFLAGALVALFAGILPGNGNPVKQVAAQLADCNPPADSTGMSLVSYNTPASLPKVNYAANYAPNNQFGPTYTGKVDTSAKTANTLLKHWAAKVYSDPMFEAVQVEWLVQGHKLVDPNGGELVTATNRLAAALAHDSATRMALADALVECVKSAKVVNGPASYETLGARPNRSGIPQVFRSQPSNAAGKVLEIEFWKTDANGAYVTRDNRISCDNQPVARYVPPSHKPGPPPTGQPKPTPGHTSKMTCLTAFGPGYSGTFPACPKDGSSRVQPTQPRQAPGTNPAPAPASSGDPGSNQCYSLDKGLPVPPNPDGSCPAGSFGG